MRLLPGPFQAVVPGSAFSRWIALSATAAGAETPQSSATPTTAIQPALATTTPGCTRCRCRLQGVRKPTNPVCASPDGTSRIRDTPTGRRSEHEHRYSDPRGGPAAGEPLAERPPLAGRRADVHGPGRRTAARLGRPGEHAR